MIGYYYLLNGFKATGFLNFLISQLITFYSVVFNRSASQKLTETQ